MLISNQFEVSLNIATEPKRNSSPTEQMLLLFWP